MTYFEIRNRLEALSRFRLLCRDYAEFTERDDNPAARIVREKMEPLLPLVLDSLRRVGLGATVTRDAPARGGRKVRVNIIKAIFREQVRKRYSLDWRAPLSVLDNGIAVYQTRLWRALVQLFNPFFWLYHFTAFVAALPLLVLGQTGVDTEHIQLSAAYRFYLVVFQLVVTAGLLYWTGVLTWFRFDILAL